VATCREKEGGAGFKVLAYLFPHGREFTIRTMEKREEERGKARGQASVFSYKTHATAGRKGGKNF